MVVFTKNKNDQTDLDKFSTHVFSIFVPSEVFVESLIFLGGSDPKYVYDIITCSGKRDACQATATTSWSDFKTFQYSE